MGAPDLLQYLRATGFSLTADGDCLVVRPAAKLTDDIRAALRQAKPELLVLLSEAADEPVPPVATLARTCTGCQHLARRKTCTEPAAAGLDPPLGLAPGADWFGIRWPPAGHGATCMAFSGKTPTAASFAYFAGIRPSGRT